jgi:hypothetical protein
LLEKIDYAAQFGIHVLSDGYQGFSTEKFFEEMDRSARAGELKGVTITLDAIKQFVRVMHKENSTAVAKKLRWYTKCGATIIALGHTNKNVRDDGRPQFAGTSDLVEQFDACYLLYEIGVDDASKTRTVLFENIKARGKVAKRACYRYCVAEGQTYEQVLGSIEPIDDEQSSALEVQRQQHADKVAIDVITQAIADGVAAKMDLIASAATRSGLPRRAIQAVLERYTGKDPGQHRWSYSIHARGEKRFALLNPPPSAKASLPEDDDLY